MSTSSTTSSGIGEFGRGRTIFVLAIVVGCFAVLWPKVFYPMFTASIYPTGEAEEGRCCDVISERDTNAYKIMTEICNNIIRQDYKALDPGQAVLKSLPQPQPLPQKLRKPTARLCRDEILKTCGVDIMILMQENAVMTKEYKESLGQLRSFNTSYCLKISYGVDFGEVGLTRMTKEPFSLPSHMRPERPFRPEMVHPALREKGRAIPNAPRRTIEREARPGPVPGVRPPVGGAGHIPTAPKGSGTMGIVMPMYTIGIVCFFVYTLMKILFKKPPEDPLVVRQPILKDYGMDPEHRKFVFSEEYTEKSERSMKDEYNKEDRDLGVRRKSSGGRGRFHEDKRRLEIETDPEREPNLVESESFKQADIDANSTTAEEVEDSLDSLQAPLMLPASEEIENYVDNMIDKLVASAYQRVKDQTSNENANIANPLVESEAEVDFVDQLVETKLSPDAVVISSSLSKALYGPNTSEEICEGIISSSNSEKTTTEITLKPQSSLECTEEIISSLPKLDESIISATDLASELSPDVEIITETASTPTQSLKDKPTEIPQDYVSQPSMLNSLESEISAELTPADFTSAALFFDRTIEIPDLDMGDSLDQQTKISEPELQNLSFQVTPEIERFAEEIAQKICNDALISTLSTLDILSLKSPLEPTLISSDNVQNSMQPLDNSSSSIMTSATDTTKEQITVQLEPPSMTITVDSGDEAEPDIIVGNDKDKQPEKAIDDLQPGESPKSKVELAVPTFLADALPIPTEPCVVNKQPLVILADDDRRKNSEPSLPTNRIASEVEITPVEDILEDQDISSQKTATDIPLIGGYVTMIDESRPTLPKNFLRNLKSGGVEICSFDDELDQDSDGILGTLVDGEREKLSHRVMSLDSTGSNITVKERGIEKADRDSFDILEDEGSTAVDREIGGIKEIDMGKQSPEDSNNSFGNKYIEQTSQIGQINKLARTDSSNADVLQDSKSVEHELGKGEGVVEFAKTEDRNKMEGARESGEILGTWDSQVEGTQGESGKILGELTDECRDELGVGDKEEPKVTEGSATVQITQGPESEQLVLEAEAFLVSSESETVQLTPGADGLQLTSQPDADPVESDPEQTLPQPETVKLTPEFEKESSSKLSEIVETIESTLHSPELTASINNSIDKTNPTEDISSFNLEAGKSDEILLVGNVDQQPFDNLPETVLEAEILHQLSDLSPTTYESLKHPSSLPNSTPKIDNSISAEPEAIHFDVTSDDQSVKTESTTNEPSQAQFKTLEPTGEESQVHSQKSEVTIQPTEEADGNCQPENTNLEDKIKVEDLSPEKVNESGQEHAEEPPSDLLLNDDSSASKSQDLAKETTNTEPAGILREEMSTSESVDPEVPLSPQHSSVSSSEPVKVQGAFTLEIEFEDEEPSIEADQAVKNPLDNSQSEPPIDPSCTNTIEIIQGEHKTHNEPVTRDEEPKTEETPTIEGELETEFIPPVEPQSIPPIEVCLSPLQVSIVGVPSAASVSLETEPLLGVQIQKDPDTPTTANATVADGATEDNPAETRALVSVLSPDIDKEPVALTIEPNKGDDGSANPNEILGQGPEVPEDNKLTEAQPTPSETSDFDAVAVDVKVEPSTVSEETLSPKPGSFDSISTSKVVKDDVGMIVDGDKGGVVDANKLGQPLQAGKKPGHRDRDARDVEIDMLRKRLEETEAAMERIVAQMGSVSDRLSPSILAQVLKAQGVRQEDAKRRRERSQTSKEQLSEVLSKPSSLKSQQSIEKEVKFQLPEIDHSEEDEEGEDEIVRPPTPPKTISKKSKHLQPSNPVINYAQDLSANIMEQSAITAAKAQGQGQSSSGHPAKESVAIVGFEETVELRSGEKWGDRTPTPTFRMATPPVPHRPPTPPEHIPSIFLEGPMPTSGQQLMVSDSQVEIEGDYGDDDYSNPIILSGKVTLSVISGGGGAPDEVTEASSLSLDDRAQAGHSESKAIKTEKGLSSAKKSSPDIEDYEVNKQAETDTDGNHQRLQEDTAGDISVMDGLDEGKHEELPEDHKDEE